MKSLLVFVLLLSLPAHAFGHKQSAPLPSPTPSVLPTSTPPSVPGRVTLQAVLYYTTPAEREKLVAVQVKLNTVIQSKCFHDFMAQRALIQTNGLSAPQVADRLQSLGGIVPVVMYYRRFTSAVAYRNVGDDTINLNRRFFWPEQPTCQWASTVGHESVGHSLGGFDHDFKWSPSREFSVPYSINHAFDVCCDPS